MRELRSIGISLLSWPPDKALEKKTDEKFAGDVMRISFIKGVALGFNFPNEFTTYWDNTFRIRPHSEWKEMYERGVVHTEVQQIRTLKEAIAEIGEAAIAWAAEEASGILNNKDIESLQQLVTEN